ncbi:MAG TPA: 6-carboxytetrahydropterin synthase QueD [Microscillaceae bacterium]|jgi:6-pyruvoyltetrahydropterin/6-carboxytetrahydropterin synthase|nr:6-carboxytetrahydropterin synthase QueD [Microscillaceae bacterium]
MVYLCRRESFQAAHRLFNPAWSDAENEEAFGVCANPNWHGHNFELIVTVKGQPLPETGCVIDLKRLSRIIRQEVIERLDHKNLNLDVDFLQGKIPSCEIIVIEIWKILAQALRPYANVQLHALKLIETKNNFVEYFGEPVVAQ